MRRARTLRILWSSPSPATWSFSVRDRSKGSTFEWTHNESSSYRLGRFWRDRLESALILAKTQRLRWQRRVSHHERIDEFLRHAARHEIAGAEIRGSAEHVAVRNDHERQPARRHLHDQRRVPGPQTVVPHEARLPDARAEPSQPIRQCVARGPDGW